MKTIIGFATCLALSGCATDGGMYDSPYGTYGGQYGGTGVLTIEERQERTRAGCRAEAEPIKARMGGLTGMGAFNEAVEVCMKRHGFGKE